MAAWRYGFNFLVLKISLTRSLRSLVRDIIRISAQPTILHYRFFFCLRLQSVPAQMLFGSPFDQLISYVRP